MNGGMKSNFVRQQNSFSESQIQPALPLPHTNPQKDYYDSSSSFPEFVFKVVFVQTLGEPAYP